MLLTDLTDLQPISEFDDRPQRRDASGQPIFEEQGNDKQLMWASLHCPIHPFKLHALGYLQYVWNGCENSLARLLHNLLELPESHFRILFHDLPEHAIAKKIKELLPTIKPPAPPPEIITAIENTLAVFDVCRINRNQLTHYGLEVTDVGVRIRRNKGSGELKEFDDSIDSIQRVVDDCVQLQLQLQVVYQAIFFRSAVGSMTFGPYLTKDGMAVVTSWPRILNVPKTLWPPNA